MKSRVLFSVLLAILLVPHTSSWFSGLESILVRFKTLIFGELLFAQSSSSFFNQSCLGAFLFDIGSDIYNGNSFINYGNPIWGTVILGVMFLPMTVLYIGVVILCSDFSDRAADLLPIYADRRHRRQSYCGSQDVW